MSKRGLVVSFALIGVLAAGCGSEEEGGLTKAQYVKRGNAICQGVHGAEVAKFRLFMKTHGSARKSGAVQRELIEEVALPSIGEGMRALAELKAPSDDEERVAAIVEELERALAKSEAEVAKLGRNSNPFAKANKLARQYGLDRCAELF